MDKKNVFSAIFGLTMNFILFLIKLFVGIGSGSLAIYCDAINNAGDMLSCIIALAGFLLILKYDSKKGIRIQSLFSFVIGIILAVTSLYFAYNGIERLLYPVAVSYLRKYAILIGLTILIKALMGIVYYMINKKNSSPILKTLIMDSVLDTIITLSTLLGLTLSVKLNFAIDSIISIVIGVLIGVMAIKTVISHSKILINE